MPYIRLPEEVHTGLEKKDNPACKSSPTIAKFSGMRKRGSSKKSPFQLACMTNNDMGKG